MLVLAFALWACEPSTAPGCTKTEVHGDSVYTVPCGSVVGHGGLGEP